MAKRIVTNPATLGELLDLADEKETRTAYEWFRRRPQSPRLTFEKYALAYGLKKCGTEEELWAEYQQLREDIARDLTAVEIEFHGIPSFTEFKEYRRYA